MKRTSIIAGLVAGLMWSAALAQSVGGNASISATVTSANVVLPASTSMYPSLLLQYGVGAATNEIFYKLGTDNTVSASTSDPALPANGVCVAAGPNRYVAARTGTSTGTLRITQLSTCPP